MCSNVRVVVGGRPVVLRAEVGNVGIEGYVRVLVVARDAAVGACGCPKISAATCVGLVGIVFAVLVRSLLVPDGRVVSELLGLGSSPWGVLVVVEGEKVERV